MDSKLKEARTIDIPYYEPSYEEGFDTGFLMAIELLRGNKFMGHYADQCATWLEKHLSEEVSSNTTSTKKGFK